MAQRSPKRAKLAHDPATEVAATNGTLVTLKTPSSRSSEVFIRSLPYTLTQDAFAAHFSFVAPIKHCTLVLDPATKQSRGFGFVTYADPEDAQRAVAELDKTTLDGRKIRVEIAEARHRKDGSAPRLDIKSNVDKATKTRETPRLIVRNLPWSVTDAEQVAVLFRKYGKVKHVELPKKKGGRKDEMRGFAIVVMRGRKQAERAVKEISEREGGLVVDGRQVAVDWAVDKQTWEASQQHAEVEDNDSAAPIDDSSIKSEDEEKDVDMSDIPESGAEDWEDAESDNDSEMSEEESKPLENKDHSSETLFLRNLPFDADDTTLHAHFSQFGPLRYARIVMDQSTGLPRGTGFICFYNEKHAYQCLIAAPRPNTAGGAPGKSKPVSLLQDDTLDPSGRYTMSGRVIQVSAAVSHADAERLRTEGENARFTAQGDKRRIYLLNEGTVDPKSSLFKDLPPSEIKLRETSFNQRKTLLQKNPTLHLSLHRLSLRNLPRHVTSQDLKTLARQAVVGFAKDVKSGKRSQLTKEELARGGDEDRTADSDRKKRGKGIVKQAKVVYEVKGSTEGAGRSRGYGFIEYVGHRWALMGLRWLNGREIKPEFGSDETKTKKAGPAKLMEEVDAKKRRLIVEFAIENAQVVHRRMERETKAKQLARPPRDKKAEQREKKRKRDETDGAGATTKKKKREGAGTGTGVNPVKAAATNEEDEKRERLAKASRIIARKRQLRRARAKKS